MSQESEVCLGSSEQTLIKQKLEWRPTQVWACKPNNSDWNILPAGYEPGWFYDTQKKEFHNIIRSDII
jgi:hypothetical protein